MLTINQEKCIQCEACVNDCHRSALKLVDNKIQWNSEICMACGHCLAVCPRDCIIIDGDGYNCDDVEDMAFSKKPTASMVRNLIMSRRSVRSFSDTAVTDEEINGILEAGKYAPTGMNIQGNAFVIVRGEKVGELLRDTVDAFKRRLDAGMDDPVMARMMKGNVKYYEEKGKDGIFYGSPVVIYIFADNDVDGAICATNMGFMANAQQLGFCFIRIPTHAYGDAQFAAKWGAPEGKKCVIALGIGNSEPEYFCSVPRLTPPAVIFE